MHDPTLPDPHLRRLLDRIPDPPDRGVFFNWFCFAVRAGITDPRAMCRHVTELLKGRTKHIETMFGDHNRDLEALALLTDHADEALDLARYAVEWEALPSQVKKAIKRQRAKPFLQSAMEGKEPTRIRERDQNDGPYTRGLKTARLEFTHSQ